MTFEIAGARCPASDPEAVLSRAREWCDGRGCEVLLADARAVLGSDHLTSSAIHAERAKARATMAARSVAIEALRYLAGERQVADAIRAAGIRPDTTAVGIAVFGPVPVASFIADVGWSRDDSVLDPSGKDAGALGITTTEQETVPEGRRHDLALERTALLDVVK